MCKPEMRGEDGSGRSKQFAGRSVCERSARSPSNSRQDITPLCLMPWHLR